jgi:class 3 adenylate cyclase
LTKVIDRERKPVADFAGNVEGFSRLMGVDEVGTLRHLTQRRAVLDGLMSEHHGRILNTAGDSVLAEMVAPLTPFNALSRLRRLTKAITVLSPDLTLLSDRGSRSKAATVL